MIYIIRSPFPLASSPVPPCMQVMRILGSLDLDGNQMVDYLEFIAATMRGVANGLSDSEVQERLLQAFKHFDRDQSGFIIVENIKVTGSSNIGSAMNLCDAMHTYIRLWVTLMCA